MACVCPKASRIILLFLAGILSILILEGCAQGASPDNDSSAASEDCYLVNHAAGETCVSRDTEQIVTLDTVSFENVVALGLQPVATTHVNFLEHLLSEDFAEVVDLGDGDRPGLERVLQIKPNLIFGLEEQQAFYSHAAQTAPTVMIPFERSGDWKEMFAFTAQALDKADQVQEVMATYNTRLAELNQAILTLNEGNKPTISVVRIYPDGIALYTKVGFIGTILEDAELPRPASQDLNFEETKAFGFSTIQYKVSAEAFDKADADVIFIIVGNWDDQIDDALAALKADPLWSSLKAVQQGNVYEVGDHWIGSGPIAANAVIDDLFKHLLDMPNGDL